MGAENKLDITEKLMLVDGKKHVIAATTKYPSIEKNIKSYSRQLVVNATGVMIDSVSDHHPVTKAIEKYTKKIAHIALRKPTGSPDFSSDNWKQEYADMCVEALMGDPNYDVALEESKQEILSNLPVERHKQYNLSFAFSFLLPLLANNTCVVANMINSGNNPALLLLTPSEEGEVDEYLIKIWNEAGEEISFITENWPKRK